MNSEEQKIKHRANKEQLDGGTGMQTDTRRDEEV